MGAVTLNVRTSPRRMLSPKDAAEYCGYRSVKTFLAECPVARVKYRSGLELYDIRDLDDWIDGLKAGTADSDVEAVLARLG